MKNIIIILLAISPLLGYSQIDSAAIKINLSVQARDVEYIGSFIPNKDEYEDIFDAAKSKFRVANPPSGNTNVAIDSITVKTWYLISDKLRKDYIAIQANIFSRIDALLRAKNIPYLTRLLNEANAYDMQLYINTRQFGRFKLRKQSN